MKNYNLSKEEWNRLKAYSYAARFAPYTRVTSRRTSKSKSTATGQTGLVGTGRIVSTRVKYITWKDKGL